MGSSPARGSTFFFENDCLGWAELALLWESQGLNTLYMYIQCTPLGYWYDAITSVFNSRCVSKPSSRQAIAVVLQWLDCRGPAVTTMSHPLAFTSARWNSIARTYTEIHVKCVPSSHCRCLPAAKLLVQLCLISTPLCNCSNSCTCFMFLCLVQHV